jgi:hypothetical protein
MVDMYPWITLVVCIVGSAVFYFAITSLNTLGA